MENVDSFVFYTSWLEAIKELDEVDQPKTVFAIMDYQAYHVEPDLTGAPKAIFMMAKPLADKAYQNRMASKMNGKKGGRPKKMNWDEKPNENLTEPNSNQTKPNPNLNEYVYEYEYAYEDGNSVNNTSVLFAPHDDACDPLYRLKLKSGNQPVFKEDINYLQHLYPAVSVEQEIRNMVGWCDSNPAKRKTKTGIKAFITKWLNKVQNKLGQAPDELKDKAREAYIKDVDRKLAYKERKESDWFE